MAETNPHTEPAWRDFNDTDARDARRDLVTTAPWLTPYLGLRARLSQVWINRWTVLLLLVLVRILFAIADIEDKIDSAKGDALSSCTAMENVGSTMASAPHYMALGVNELTAIGVEKAIDGLMSMLTMTVTGVEEIIIFAINVWTQTYLCLITLAISGALHVALSVIEDVTHFINDTIGAVGKDLHSAIDGFDNDLNKAIGGINKIFHGHIPTLNVGSDLDKLDHLQLPSGLDHGLQKLNSSIPNFNDVNNLTQTALRFPFEELKSLISNHTGHYTFNRSEFPVPNKQKLTFCSNDNGISDFFNGLLHVEQTARKVAIAVLVLLAIGVIAPMTWWEIQRWKMMQQKAQYVDDHAFDSMDAVYVISRPWSSRIGIETANRVTSDYKRRTLIRWVIAYCTSTPALFVLSLGLAGVFSGLIHYFCLKALTHEVPQLEKQVANFADDIMHTVNNISTTWANETNGVILGMNSKVNHDVFGWVDKSTTAMNNTLNTASNEMVHALQVVFNGTILEQPIMDVYNCLIGLKIAGIEKALSWVHNHAHVDFPLLPNDTFALSHLSQKAGNDPDTNAAANLLDDPDSDAEGAIKKIVSKLIDKIEHHILQELAISAVVLGLWFIVLFMGVGRMLWLMFRPSRTRGTGAGILHGKWFGRSGHNHSLASTPTTPRSPTGGKGFAGVSEAAINEKDVPVNGPPVPEHRNTNPFDTPRFPSFHPPSPPPVIHVPPSSQGREPTLPNVEDNNGAHFRGQDYTLAPAPLPLFSQGQGRTPQADDGMISPKSKGMGIRSVSGGAVAPVMGHPRTSWRPEVVGGAGPGREERMDSVWMVGKR
ncbi:MAG: hypothetical protein Q9162_005581 [Coniocarpon cinnabarinum]